MLLPKSQTLVYEGRTYQSDAEGYSIERIDKISDAVKEDSLDCSEIYPSREGTVSKVETMDVGKNFYDIIDNSIPAELNFNDYIIEGETATISFQKGMLAGDDKQFEFKYNHSERRFELVPQEIDGVTMPNETFKPAVGDTYAIFGIMLPDAYICNNTDKTGASWDMFREAARKLYENEDPKFTFTGTLQGLWAKKNWLRVGGRLKVGGYVLFTDEQFVPDGIAIRITGIKEYLTSPYAPVLEISNSVSGKSVSSQLREIGQNEVATDNSIRNAVSYTKRRFRDVRETMAMLEDSMLDNFTNSINPLTVQTMMMLVGDESLQFRFVASKTDLTAVNDGITYDNAAKQLHIPHGFIQHMTLGIGTISSSHADSEYKVWEMSEYLSPYLDNGEKKYYLYAKVSRTDTTAKSDFLLSDRAIKMNDVAGYYHLLVGILNSEYDGERSYVSLYGFSEILPGRITTDKIVSSDGQSFWHLIKNQFRAGDANKAFEWNIGDSGAFNIIGARIETNKDRSRIVLNPNSRRIEMYYNDTLIAFWSSDANGSFINIMPREGGAANKYAAISSNAISLNRDFPDGLSYLSEFNSDNANLWVRGQRNARVVNFIVGVKNTNTNGYPILKILMDGIPTSDPKVYGQVWRDGTTLKISQG